jgi:alkanesulfonate monooxygenase SsuD/methylene tetrahydromethanopterin reductase-like flavin-dependent oxidoreductase (luciferase family)
MMNISLGLTTSIPIKEGLKLALLADKIGFKRVFIGEDILSRDVFVYLSVIALETSRIELATGITSPYVRHIASLASNILAIQKISGERFTLGLGPGGIPELERFLGKMPEKPILVMRDATLVIKKLFSGEKVDYEGVLGKIKGFKLASPNPIKIYFGVRGEKLLKLAGKIADGVIFSGPKSYLKKALKIVEEKSSKKTDFNKIVWNCFLLAKNKEELKLGKQVAATIISSLPEKEIGNYPELIDKTFKIKEAFKKGNYAKAEEFIDEEILKQFCFAGELNEIEEEIIKLEKEGFKEFVVGPPFGKKPEEAILELRKLL